MRTIGAGARGEDVRDVQARLGALGFHIDADEHGVFGESTGRAVREFQQRRRLAVDGLVGEDTWQELVEAGRSLGDRILYLRSPYFRGDDVRALQRSLNLLGFDAGREDGIHGPRTDRAVRDFQRNVGLPQDGIVGAVTLGALGRLRPVGAGPGRAAVREGEALRRLAASLSGSRVAVDAGHGPSDPGHVGPSGLTEAEAAWLLADALVRELGRRGADPLALRTLDSTPTGSERAAAANRLGAELLVSLHLGGDEDRGADRASSYYYGWGSYVSPAGHRLAELIQEGLATRLALPAVPAQPKSFPLLRETAMPAVHVEPCFITNPRSESRLRSAAFREEVALVVADAMERLLNAGERGSGGREPELPGAAGHRAQGGADQGPEQQRVGGP